MKKKIKYVLVKKKAVVLYANVQNSCNMAAAFGSLICGLAFFFLCQMRPSIKILRVMETRESYDS